MKPVGRFPEPHLVLGKGPLHLGEGGGELPDEVVFPAGVVVPDQALRTRGPSAPAPGPPGVPPPGPPDVSTFSGRASSQLHRELSDTLKGSHTGLRLSFTTWAGRGWASGRGGAWDPTPLGNTSLTSARSPGHLLLLLNRLF